MHSIKQRTERKQKRINNENTFDYKTNSNKINKQNKQNKTEEKEKQ